MTSNKLNQKFILEKKNLISLLNKLQFDNKFSTLCFESIKAIKNKKKIFFVGNGGSAADAQHLATELTVRFKKNRKALPAIALTTDASAITAIGNDFRFENIFSRQLDALGNKGDICLAITTSGNSKNLIETAKIAKLKKINFFCLSGNNGGKIKNYTKNIIIIPSNITADIQVVEIFIGHIFCDVLENSFLK